MDEPEDNLMLSANLAAVVGKEETKVHAGEPDEGQVNWTAPKFSGLSNSDTVDVKGGHWNKDSPLLPVPPTPGTAAAMVGTSPPGKAGANPGFALPTAANGQIDWGAMVAK